MASPTEKEGNLPFKCSVYNCDKEYKHKNALKRHADSIHFGINFGCSFCSRTFMRKQSRDDHIVSAHTLEKGFQCEKCPSKFPTAGYLWQHRKVHSEPHECTICSKRFKERCQLRKHTEALHNPSRTKNFGCSICQRKYFMKSDLKRHELTHSQDGDKFGCYFCKKRFFTRVELERHIRIHTQEKPFICTEESCQYSSSQLYGLIRHTKNRHSPLGQRIQSKTWSCYFCSKTLSSSHSLLNHLRIHTMEQPFSCGLCQKHFSTQQELQYHISSHTMEKPFRCNECHKCFTRRNELQSHVGSVHKGEKRFFCKYCSYSSYGKSAFNRHILRHDTKTG